MISNWPTAAVEIVTVITIGAVICFGLHVFFREDQDED